MRRSRLDAVQAGLTPQQRIRQLVFVDGEDAAGRMKEIYAATPPEQRREFAELSRVLARTYKEIATPLPHIRSMFWRVAVQVSGLRMTMLRADFHERLWSEARMAMTEPIRESEYASLLQKECTRYVATREVIRYIQEKTGLSGPDVIAQLRAARASGLLPVRKRRGRTRVQWGAALSCFALDPSIEVVPEIVWDYDIVEDQRWTPEHDRRCRLIAEMNAAYWPWPDFRQMFPLDARPPDPDEDSEDQIIQSMTWDSMETTRETWMQLEAMRIVLAEVCERLGGDDLADELAPGLESLRSTVRSTASLLEVAGLTELPAPHEERVQELHERVFGEKEKKKAGADRIVTIR